MKCTEGMGPKLRASSFEATRVSRSPFSPARRASLPRARHGGSIHSASPAHLRCGRPCSLRCEPGAPRGPTRRSPRGERGRSALLRPPQLSETKRKRANVRILHRVVLRRGVRFVQSRIPPQRLLTPRQFLRTLQQMCFNPDPCSLSVLSPAAPTTTTTMTTGLRRHPQVRRGDQQRRDRQAALRARRVLARAPLLRE
jgi:hypothetical protein